MYSSELAREGLFVDSYSTTTLIGFFLVAAGATWIAGVFLSDATDVIDDRFNLGEAMGGLILLGVAGTLPEIAITVSAAMQGHLGLATGNLLGGIAMQTLVLVLLDATSRSKTPLTTLSTVLEPIVEAIFVIMLVTMALLGPLLPASVAIGPVSPISLLIVITWVFGLFVLNRLRKSERWTTAAADRRSRDGSSEPGPGPGSPPQPLRAVGDDEGRRGLPPGRWGHPGGGRGPREQREGARERLGHQRRDLRGHDPRGRHRAARGQHRDPSRAPRSGRSRDGGYLRREPGADDAVPVGRPVLAGEPVLQSGQRRARRGWAGSASS